jgi:polyphosphate glucokinase
MKTLKQASTATKILAVDIGGSNIKATLLNEHGEMIADYKKLPTPVPATPDNVIAAIEQLTKNFPGFEKVSVGFPGYVKNGVIMTAPNLGTEAWRHTPFAERLGTALQKPVRVVNDADMQGLGVVSGKGFEIVVTLGTGFGTAVLYNGVLLPHLELAHHPVTKTKDYDAYIGDKEMARVGKQRWNKRMMRVLDILKTVFNYDHLYIGGGNSDELTFKLDDNITIVNNKDGIKGGARLWFQPDVK